MSMLVNGRATYIIMDIRSVPALAIFFKRLLSISRMSKYKAKVSKIMRMMFKKYVMIKVIFFLLVLSSRVLQITKSTQHNNYITLFPIKSINIFDKNIYQILSIYTIDSHHHFALQF